MDSMDEKVTDAAGRAALWLALLTPVVTGALVGLQLGDTGWAVLGGAATGMGVWCTVLLVVITLARVTGAGRG